MPLPPPPLTTYNLNIGISADSLPPRIAVGFIQYEQFLFLTMVRKSQEMEYFLIFLFLISFEPCGVGKFQELVWGCSSRVGFDFQGGV